MGLKEEIKKKVKYILETERDEDVLNRLNEELAGYQVRQRGKNESVKREFTVEELQEIDAAHKRTEKDGNLVPHEEVMKGLWEKLEAYIGKNKRSEE